MRKSTTPKGVASPLALLPRVGCVALADPAFSKVQPRWGNDTPRGLVEIGRGGLHMDGILFVWNCVEKYDGDW